MADQQQQQQQQQQSSVEYDKFILDVLTTAKYRDPERTSQDVLEILLQYPGLKPITETHVYSNGIEQLLLALSGTIPIHHKGQLYYIPILIWLLNTYPYNAPMVFVKPTPDMRIKVSEHVAPDGKVSLPYLQEWNHNSSELILLVQVLIITFQDEPPVYSIFTSPPPIPYHPLSSPQSTSSYQQQQQQGSTTITLSPHRAGLLRIAEEKLVVQLLKTYQSTEEEKKVGDQLRFGSEKLTMMLQRVEAEKLILEQDVQKCEKDVQIARESLVTNEAEVAQREATVIEDAIQIPRPLYNQIVSSYAEDQALEDAIYYVSEGLRSGRMELDQFEKCIRKLARKQFMLRLLISKCRSKAGLA